MADHRPPDPTVRDPAGRGSEDAGLTPRASEPPSAEQLIRAFDAAPAHTVGLEEEVMLLDPSTLELAPRAQEVVDLLDDGRFKLELPAAQLEIATPPAAGVTEAIDDLRKARRLLADEASGLVKVAGAGLHPFSAGEGQLNAVPRYAETIARYGPLARRQLVFAFQVHVAVGSAERALAVYNAARSYLPLIAALAANSPFYEGRETGLASTRAKLCELLPRQGVPPEIASWAEHAENLRWGAAAGGLPTPRSWWWELRPHPTLGTLEFRVPDAQSSVGEAAAIAAVLQSLVAWLGERHQAGEWLAVAPSWRIAENRLSACRRGVEGEMADLNDGQVRPTHERLHELLDILAPVARQLGCQAELQGARPMIEANGAMGQREVGRRAGPRALVAWLAERFGGD